MKRILSLNKLAASFLVLASTLLLQGETLEPGDSFPKFEAEDQHGKPYPIPSDTEHIAVTFAMGSGKKANKFFAEQGASYLSENQTVFLSNIYGMPGIARTFAIPKMQKYPHRIMLADEKGLLDDFPQEKGKVTIFDLNEEGAITAIRFWDPATGDPEF